MSDPIATFFAAWQQSDSDTRHATISSTVIDSVHYHDPRTPETITNVNGLVDYVGMFSTNAPGWSAKVIKSDTTADVTRVTVAFGGPGPEGKQMMQHGQYFIEMEGELISRMIGFVGTGA